MRKQTKLTFSRQDGRPVLSPSEAVSWRDALKKILKLGFEHEFNLQESKGNCKGDSFKCPCSHPLKKTRKCYAKCLMGGMETCGFAKEYGECPGIYCIEFVSPCHTCPEAVRDCSLCDLYENPEKKPGAVRKRLTATLEPTNDLSTVGKAGVLQVTTDGSLTGDGGVEIPTVGRRINFASLYEQTKSVMDRCFSEGAYISSRTSLHIHLVSGYYNIKKGNSEVVYNKGHNEEYGDGIKLLNELENPLPEIVLANFHQLIRRYQMALVWITSSGLSEDKLTRWAKFREPTLKYSAQTTKMNKVADEIVGSVGSNGKYAFVNYCKTSFDAKGNVTKLHLEARFPDNVFSPSAATAFGVLVSSLLIKAVMMSQYGVLYSGTKEYMSEASEICKYLMNNNGPPDDQRSSDTSKFHLYRENVRNQAMEMVTILEKELREHGNSFDVLLKLAEHPCSMRLIRGDSWAKIEEDLRGDTQTIGQVALTVLESIDTGYVLECANPSEWVSVVSEDNGIDRGTLESTVNELAKRNMIRWEPSNGTFVRL